MQLVRTRHGRVALPPEVPITQNYLAGAFLGISLPIALACPVALCVFAHWVRHRRFSHVSSSLEPSVLVVTFQRRCALCAPSKWSSIFAQSRLSLGRKSWRCVRKRFFDDRMLQRTHAICRELCVSGTDIRLPQGWPLSGHCRNSIFGG